MQLVIAETDTGVWVQLEGETAPEMRAPEDRAQRGEWTSGRGVEAISRLRALAGRLGYPCGTVRE